MLSYEDRMISHRCLLAVIFRISRGKTFGYKIMCMLFDYSQPLVL